LSPETYEVFIEDLQLDRPELPEENEQGEICPNY